MCLVTKQRKAKIAKKDITCYKHLRRFDLTTTYQFYVYNVGRLDKTHLSFGRNNHWCLADEAAMNFYWKASRKRVLTEVIHGFHAYLSIDRAQAVMCEGNEGLYEFLIPAGSEYFTDKTGLIVSNQIMLVNDINLYEK